MDIQTPPFLELHNAVVQRAGAPILTVDSFRLEEGEHLALLGPNGSGKSTFVKLITREVLPLHREVPPVRFRGSERATLADVKRSLGVVSSTMQDQISVHLPTADVVAGGLYGTLGVPARVDARHLHEARERAREVMELLGVDELAARDIMTLSTGQARRVLIARALVHDPDVIIFDEPTNGLDPSGIVEMRAFLQGLNRDKGITIVISSHHLAELEQMATTYAFLKQGCVVEQVSAHTLQERCADYVDIAVSDAARFTALLEKELRHERYLVLLDGTVRIFDPAAGIEAYSGLAVRAGMDVSKLERRKMSLEQYYLELKEKGVA